MVLCASVVKIFSKIHRRDTEETEVATEKTGESHFWGKAVVARNDKLKLIEHQTATLTKVGL